MSDENGVFPIIPVLNYHHVHDEEESFFRVTPATLRAQMEVLLAEGCVPIHLDQMVELKGTAVAPEKYVLVTFDDGYEDFEYAWPVLQDLHIPVTLFLISDYIGGWNDWDSIRASPRRHMGLDRLKALQAEGVAFGSHSRCHPPLTLLDHNRLVSEIRDSKVALEDMLGVPVRTLAYPGGHVDRRVRAVTQRYYDLGFATHLGAHGVFGDPYRIPRFDPSFCGELDDFRRELRAYGGYVGGKL